MQVQSFFEEESSTLTYIVYDPYSKDAVLIDSVQNTETADFLRENNLNLKLILETHAHADHISGAPLIKEHFPEVPLGISKNITVVQKTFKEIHRLDYLTTDGSQFDILIEDGQVLHAGEISIKAIATPGHTPTCTCFLIEDMLFAGDTIFMPDFGTGRCDFPNGSAEQLYKSITEKIYTLPEGTKIFVGHDYQPDGRELKFMTTVAESKLSNKHIKATTSLEEFVSFRESRDKELPPPKKLVPSIIANVNAGHND